MIFSFGQIGPMVAVKDLTPGPFLYKGLVYFYTGMSDLYKYISLSGHPYSSLHHPDPSEKVVRLVATDVTEKDEPLPINSQFDYDQATQEERDDYDRARGDREYPWERASPLYPHQQTAIPGTPDSPLPNAAGKTLTPGQDPLVFLATKLVTLLDIYNDGHHRHDEVLRHLRNEIHDFFGMGEPQYSQRRYPPGSFSSENSMRAQDIRRDLRSRKRGDE